MPHSRAPEARPDTGHFPAESLPAGNAVPEAAPSAGLEIRLYDPNRKAQNWTEFMRPDQCAVLFRDRSTSTPFSPEGRSYPADTEYTCLLFDHLDAAQRFCEKKVGDLPSLVCEVFDSGGRAKPPLLVITHPDYESDEDSGPASSRRRKLIVGGLLAAGVALISINLWRESILATFLAFNCVLFGLRLLYWEFAVKHREQERRGPPGRASPDRTRRCLNSRFCSFKCWRSWWLPSQRDYCSD